MRQRHNECHLLTSSQIKGSTGSARERHGLFRCGAFERPVLAARRSNYSGVIFPPGPNSWPLNIPAGWPVPAYPVTFISIAQECGLFATYRAVSPAALLRIWARRRWLPDAENFDGEVS